MSKFVTELMQDFASKEYSEGYTQEYLTSRLGAQISVVRKDRGMGLDELANLAEVTLEVLSDIESGNMSHATPAILLRIASELDVCFDFRLTSYRSVAEDIDALSEDALHVPSRMDDVANDND